MDHSDGDGPSDTMRERGSGNRTKLWVLLEANRWMITGLLVSGVFATLVILGAVDPSPLRQAMTSKDPIETTFQGFLTAIITGVTLVVTLNQLVLSQELGAVGDQRERMSGSMEFRQDVEDAIEAPVSPLDPASFLQAIIDTTSERADDLTSAISEGSDDQFHTRVNDLADDIKDDAQPVSDRLSDAQFGTFDMLFAALNYDYSWKIYEARRLRNTHAESISDETEEVFDGLIRVLEFFGMAREHFKTLYFQWELVNLSRMILYTALPALLVSVAMILYVDNPGTIRGSTLGVDNLIWGVSAAVAVAVLPFVLLLSYVLRIATVAKRTLAIGPFVLRETDRTTDVDRE